VRPVAQKWVWFSRNLHALIVVSNLGAKSLLPILEPNEKTLLVETARHNSVFGNLFLTNKRIVFEHMSGVFSRQVYVTLDLPLEGVNNVLIQGTFGKRLVVATKPGFVSSFPVRLDFLVKDPALWQNQIMSAMRTKLEKIENEKTRERVQLVLDFSGLKDYMTKGGLVLQTMKCPECGAPLKLPESGNQTKCEHCGNTILAQDIFEKIKNLI
jgi:hypothetical protein